MFPKLHNSLFLLSKQQTVPTQKWCDLFLSIDTNTALLEQVGTLQRKHWTKDNLIAKASEKQQCVWRKKYYIYFSTSTLTLKVHMYYICLSFTCYHHTNNVYVSNSKSVITNWWTQMIVLPDVQIGALCSGGDVARSVYACIYFIYRCFWYKRLKIYRLNKSMEISIMQLILKSVNLRPP